MATKPIVRNLARKVAAVKPVKVMPSVAGVAKAPAKKCSGTCTDCKNKEAKKTKSVLDTPLIKKPIPETVVYFPITKKDGIGYVLGTITILEANKIEELKHANIRFTKLGKANSHISAAKRFVIPTSTSGGRAIILAEVFNEDGQPTRSYTNILAKMNQIAGLYKIVKMDKVALLEHFHPKK